MPNWEHLLDRDIIIAYTDKCKRFKIEADGQISKLDALDAGCTFMWRSLRMIPITPCSSRRCKATLRKEKTKRRMQRMEELISCKLTLDEVDDVIQNERMWKDFTELPDKLGKDLTVSRKKMDMCTNYGVKALVTG